ncbi:coiled-coil domain-containing protein 91-like [Montipora capricornis]|uniref:coiled-coil domain-containing protein 91-like n=1 Tax=Montipora capricornis TaxID=246305 RepID=UPI0035F1B86B
MEGDRWADFGSAAANSEVNDGDDDDWAEFGGFESATPAVNGSNQSGSLITWAAVGVPPPASPSQTCQKQSTTQTTQSSDCDVVPAVTTPNLETGVSNKSSTAPWPESKPDDHSDFINSFLSSDEDFSTPFTAATSSLIAAAREKSKNETTEYDSFHADFSSFLSETANYGPSLSQDGDIIDPSSDDTTEQVIISQDNKTADFSTPNIKPVKEAPQEKASNKFEKGLEEKVSSTQNILSELQDANSAKEKLEVNVRGLEEKLSIAEREKVQLQKELGALLERINPLEHETKNLQEILEKQKEKYEQLQEQHQEQIKEIRKAGHDALAVIVEEYKELSRKAVLEQQEENKIRMEKVLEDQQAKFQDFLQDQQESFERVLQGERRNSDKKAMDLLEEEKQRHKTEIESCLQEERVKGKEALNEALEDARRQNLEAIEIARKEERRKYEEFVAERETSMRTLTDQEGKRLQLVLEDAMKEEKERNQIALESSLTEERKRGREYAEEIKEQTKKEMLEYFMEKQEADKTARQKHLHCLDLFLESARAQLKTLMEEQPGKDPPRQPNGT